MEMKDRILEFLKMENKSSAQLAEEIGVQPSGISHILSGRNKPSLDFILKMLSRYSFISTEWLLFGRGRMYREPLMANLFTGVEGESHENHRQEEPVRKAVDHAPVIADFKEDTDHETGIGDGTVEPETQWRPERIRERKHKTVRIVCFYDDNSFDEYYPANE